MTLLDNAHGAVKELFSYFERPVCEANYEELPILFRFLPRPDTEFVYVVVHGKDMAVVLLQPKPAITMCLLEPGTTKNWTENKFEAYRALWHKAHDSADLIINVHRMLKEGPTAES